MHVLSDYIDEVLLVGVIGQKILLLPTEYGGLGNSDPVSNLILSLSLMGIVLCCWVSAVAIKDKGRITIVHVSV